ncbi:MAG: polysaccharide deacetylase family protein [Planctomycetota bacterium]
MTLRRLGVLAPCEALADFPIYFHGEDAECLLAAWTTAWRPALIAAAGRPPEVVSAFEPPPAEDWRDGLVLVTSVCDTGEADEWLAAIRSPTEGRAHVVERFVTRGEIIAATDQALPELPQVNAELEREFFALAYAYLQVATLTHDLAYGAVFDLARFEADVVAAATHAVAEEAEQASRRIDACYDQLLQARNHAYPADIQLLDVVLTAPTTLGEALADEAGAGVPLTILLTGKNAGALSAGPPATRDRLRLTVDAGAVAIACGGYGNHDLSTLAPESLLAELRGAQSAIKRATGAAPSVFAQHTSALPPRLPQALEQLGFTGALLTGFDGREPASTDHGRTTWMGIDGSGLQGVVATPRDLGRPETLLKLSEHLSETLGRDQTPTLLLAGWPGARHEALGDLRRVAKRSPVLGAFVNLEEYFRATHEPDHWGMFHVDDLGPPAPGVPRRQREQESTSIETNQATAALAGLAERLTLPALIEDDTPPTERLANVISGSGEPTQAARRLTINPSGVPAPTPAGDVAPPFGFCLERDRPRPRPAPDAGGLTLRNQTLEAKLHEPSGGLQSLRLHRARLNQASQRLVVTDRRSRAVLGTMRPEGIEPLESAPGFKSHGKLVADDGRVLAAFEQKVSLPAGGSWLAFDLAIDRGPQLREATAGGQLAFRVALPEKDWRWRRGVQWAQLPITRAGFVAGEHVSAVADDTLVTLAVVRPTPIRRFHRSRFDAVLPAATRSDETHRFALAIGGRYPMHVCLGALAAMPTLTRPFPGGAQNSGWWMHTGANNVLASAFGPVDGADRSAWVRLIETDGRGAAARLRLCRPLASARVVDFRGSPREDLSIEDGAAVVELPPYGWLQVQASW